MEETGRVPASLIDEPELAPDLGFVWDAFWRLNSDRQNGFGAGPIPNRSIVAEADRMKMDDEEAEWFGALIAAMDGVYLKWLERQKPKREV